MSPKQVDKAAARLRAQLEAKMQEDSADEREAVLGAIDLIAGMAHNLAVIAAATER